MSKLSFKTFCIEFYAEHRKMPSDEVYNLFKKEGVLDMLNEDYDDLHCYGFEYLVNLFDEYLRVV